MSDDAELLELNQRLLDAIASADWETYEQLCDPQLTAFEPEAAGQRVEGLPFHRFYFDLGGDDRTRTTMVDPRVRWLGTDAAVVTFVRLTQRVGLDGPSTQACEETRVWERRDGRWWHIHFHRSLPSAERR